MHKILFYNKFIKRLYTCFERYVLIIRRSKLYYTASGIVTPVGGRPVRRLLAGIEDWVFSPTAFCSHYIIPAVGRTRFVFRRLENKISVLVQTLLTHLCPHTVCPWEWMLPLVVRRMSTSAFGIRIHEAVILCNIRDCYVILKRKYRP